MDGSIGRLFFLVKDIVQRKAGGDSVPAVFGPNLTLDMEMAGYEL